MHRLPPEIPSFTGEDVMKRLIIGIQVFLLCSTMPLAVAQTGTTWAHLFEHHLPGISSRHPNLIQVTDNQRTHLANCMAEARQVERIVDQMSKIGRPWGRGRTDYSRHDLLVFSEREQTLNTAIFDLTTAHEQLRKNFADIHDRNLEEHLQKLGRVQAKLYSSRSQIAHDLARTHPGSGSPELSWDVDALRKAAAKWTGEHKQIAHDLDLEM
jgi:hypothetical protein